MKKELVLFALCTLSIFSSCQNEEIKVRNDIKKSEENESVRVYASNTIKALTKGILREGRDFEPKEEKPVISGEADTIGYLVNFEGGGFILFTSNERKVVTFSPNGSLSVEKDPETIRELTTNVLRQTPSLPIEDENGTPNMPGRYTETKKVTEGPISQIIEKQTTKEFDQTYPYNRKAPICIFKKPEYYYMGRYPAGCLTAALAEIFAYHRLFGYEIDWDALINVDWNNRSTFPDEDSFYNDLDFLFGTIIKRCITFGGGQFGVKPYGMAIPPKINGFVKDMGYTVEKREYNAYTIPYVYKDNKIPLMIYGEAAFFDRHYFVADGVAIYTYNDITYERTVTKRKRPGSNSPYDLIVTYSPWKEVYRTQRKDCFLSINWGWGGDHNGYFRPNALSPSQKDDTYDKKMSYRIIQPK